MRPNNIFLIRHGQSQGNIDRTIYSHTPDYAVKLTDEGKQQARDAGFKIGNLISVEKEPEIFFYVSSYHRTRQTFQEVRDALKLKGLAVSHIEDPRLREQEWSGYLRQEFMTEEQIQKIDAERDGFGHFYYRFHGGESCADVYDRVSSLLDTVHRGFAKNNCAKNVGFVTHGMMIRVFLMRWLHLTVEQFELLRNPKNGAVIHLKLNDRGKYDLITKLETWDAPLHPYQMPIVEGK